MNPHHLVQQMRRQDKGVLPQVWDPPYGKRPAMGKLSVSRVPKGQLRMMDGMIDEMIDEMIDQE